MDFPFWKGNGSPCTNPDWESLRRGAQDTPGTGPSVSSAASWAQFGLRCWRTAQPAALSAGHQSFWWEEKEFEVKSSDEDKFTIRSERRSRVVLGEVVPLFSAPRCCSDRRVGMPPHSRCTRLRRRERIGFIPGHTEGGEGLNRSWGDPPEWEQHRHWKLHFQDENKKTLWGWRSFRDQRFEIRWRGQGPAIQMEKDTAQLNLRKYNNKRLLCVIMQTTTFQITHTLNQWNSNVFCLREQWSASGS